MPKLEKQIKITLTAKEVADILKEHYKITDGQVIDKVDFNIEPTTDDHGNYSGQELRSIVCSGRLL